MCVTDRLYPLYFVIRSGVTAPTGKLCYYYNTRLYVDAVYVKHYLFEVRPGYLFGVHILTLADSCEDSFGHR